MSTSDLYRKLSDLGNYYSLDRFIDFPKFDEEIKQFKDAWVQYNPRKENQRFGLSLTSIDGGMTGIPDLDSLREYNSLVGTDFKEADFTKPTMALEKLTTIRSAIEPFIPFLGRSHIIKFKAGGFFPPHRDSYGRDKTTFRLISFLSGCSNYSMAFLLDGQRITMDTFWLYFLDTKREHGVFSFVDDTHILVLNVILSEESVATVEKHLRCT